VRDCGQDRAGHRLSIGVRCPSSCRGLYIATAIVVDVRTIPPGKKEKQDAVEVRLDHVSGYSVIETGMDGFGECLRRGIPVIATTVASTCAECSGRGNR
jgi:hypothetical protein